MANRSEADFKRAKDIRVTATTRIWSLTTGMLALCLALLSPKDSVPLSIAIASGATLSTAVVWRSPQESQRSLPTEQLEEIEQRLHRLETIASTDDLELWLQTRELASKN